MSRSIEIYPCLVYILCALAVHLLCINSKVNAQ
jgi:hypothetical protein